MPDQRGFAGSDRPQDVEAYRTDKLVDDVFALADALGIEQFALSAMTGAARSRGARRFAAIRG